jgi:hypothetical protein
MSITPPLPSTQAGGHDVPAERPASDASFPEFDARLRRLLDDAAAGIRASRTEIERAATYVETARRLLADGQLRGQPHLYSLPPYLSPAPSRWFVSSRSHRRARAAVPSRRHSPRRPPAPGSRLPCTRTGCPGTMKFGGDPVGHVQTAELAHAERTWVCSDRAGHAQLPHSRSAAPQPVALVARARWEDDGGSRR